MHCVKNVLCLSELNQSIGINGGKLVLVPLHKASALMIFPRRHPPSLHVWFRRDSSHALHMHATMPSHTTLKAVRGLASCGFPFPHVRRKDTHRHSCDLPGTLASEQGSAGPEHLRSAYKSSLAGYGPAATSSHALQAQHSRSHRENVQVNSPGVLALRWLSGNRQPTASSSSAIAGRPNRQPEHAMPRLYSGDIWSLWPANF